MQTKEHDLINFSMKADIGARRYYNKEVLCKDGNLIVNLNGNDIPLDNIYHIEVVGTSRIKIEPPTEEKGMSEREKIIKALKCCTHDGCDKCPFRKYKCTCQIDLAASALAQIEQLTERLDYFQKSSDYHEGNQKELETKNAELQKQVNELKKTNRKLFEYGASKIVEREQAVKDTAKEIYDYAKSSLRWDEEMFVDSLKHLIKERYSVKVE